MLLGPMISGLEGYIEGLEQQLSAAIRREVADTIAFQLREAKLAQQKLRALDSADRRGIERTQKYYMDLADAMTHAQAAKYF